MKTTKTPAATSTYTLDWQAQRSGAAQFVVELSATGQLTVNGKELAKVSGFGRPMPAERAPGRLRAHAAAVAFVAAVGTSFLAALATERARRAVSRSYYTSRTPEEVAARAAEQARFADAQAAHAAALDAAAPAAREFLLAVLAETPHALCRRLIVQAFNLAVLDKSWTEELQHALHKPLRALVTEVQVCCTYDNGHHFHADRDTYSLTSPDAEAQKAAAKQSAAELAAARAAEHKARVQAAGRKLNALGASVYITDYTDDIKIGLADIERLLALIPAEVLTAALADYAVKQAAKLKARTQAEADYQARRDAEARAQAAAEQARIAALTPAADPAKS